MSGAESGSVESKTGGKEGQAAETAAELLAAGAVLPPGTRDAGERAVPLTARAYRHPGLEDRVVVRLVPAELGVAEDAAAGFLGLEPAAEPAVVGLGVRQALGFPEWVLVHYPQDGHHALGIVPELERAARQAKTKPKATLDAYLELAGRLAASVPHFLPTFFEQAGRVFVGVENPVYAAQMFTKARTADAEHGLRIDEDRLDAVFLEFALAGALPVKVLAAYAKELAARLPAQEALARFTRLCVRRTAGGLPPSAQMTVELRKLAKAAGVGADAAEQEFLAEMLGLPATMRAAVGWWKAHRAAVIALARREPAVRRALLDTVPAGDGEGEMAEQWLSLLIESGIADGLYDAGAAGEVRPSDGTAGWLRRFQRMRESGGWWRNARRLPQLYPLVERCAERLRTELAATGAAPFDAPDDVDLLDLLLALRVPVADPGTNKTLNLQHWSEGEGRRDLVALAADTRFRAAFTRGADRCDNDGKGLRTLRVLIASPGGRPMLTQWMRAVAGRFAAVGLPGLPEAIARLSWLPGDVLALAEAEVRAAAATDLAPLLARTLRAGLFDELTWPAWEQAVAQLIARKDVDDLVIADAWPHLIVAGPSQARVLDADGAVLTHDLRIPADDRYGDPGLHYVDGELLVYWNSHAAGHRGKRGYWHGSADRIHSIEAQATHGTRIGWYFALDSSLPLPQGGRAVGGGVLNRGDTAVPEDQSLIGDGTSYWVWGWDGTDRGTRGWYEYDPVSGARGRQSNPAFFTDTLRGLPAGSSLRTGTLRPTADGLLGWCAADLPDGSSRGRDTQGREVAVPKDSHELIRAVVMPGDDRPRALVRGHYEIELVDADGVVTAEARTDRAPGAFAQGTALLPPTGYWHFMRPRDLEGSAALRGIDDAHAALLLKAGSEQRPASAVEDRLPHLVGELMPQVTDSALLAGIAGVVAYAAEQQATLDQVAARLDGALADGGSRDAGPNGPDDSILFEPLRSLGATRLYWTYGRENGDGVFRQIRLIGEALRDASTSDAAADLQLHLDGALLPQCATAWWMTMLESCSALAVRAAAPTTTPEVAEALRAVLRVYDEAGLAAPARHTAWRRTTVFLPDRLLNKPDGNRRSGSWQGLMPLPNGALLAVVGTQWGDGGADFTALHHDPAGRFEIPAPYTLRATAKVGEQRETGWLGAFLAEWEKRGAAPWFPEAVERFAQSTGVTLTEARLIMAGTPGLESNGRPALPADRRAVLGAKTTEIAVADGLLRRVESEALRAVVSALLPADPTLLWTEGPDAAAAAEVWNTRIGRRTAVPEALLAEATRAIRVAWAPPEALPALLGPARSPELSRDLTWKVSGDRVAPAEENTPGFTAETLVGGLALAAWLAHRVPAGDPVRDALPAALAALRARLANPDLLLNLGRYANLPEFRKAAGAPAEIAAGYERYGAVVMATHDDQPMPAVRVAHLDASGGDPYLAVLRGEAQTPFPLEIALGLARDPAFAALLGDPGDPVAGERAKDGTWSPQDPARSVPDLVAQVVAEHGLGADAAALYLMLLAMPDPTDRATARWTGWKPARLAAARAELAATDLVVSASRAKAGRSLFLPGGWTVLRAPHLPMEEWKTPLFSTLLVGGTIPLGVIVPVEPTAQHYRRVWQRVREGDGPRFTELKVNRVRTRRR